MFARAVLRWPAARILGTLQWLHDTSTDYDKDRRKHRSLQRRYPAEVYAARAKATPDHNTGGHFRIRDDKVHASGSVTLRRGGRMHHIGIGYEHIGTTVRVLIHDLHITIINADTGEIIRDLQLDTSRDYQPLGRPPGPPKKAAPNAADDHVEPPRNKRSPGTGVNDAPGLHTEPPRVP